MKEILIQPRPPEPSMQEYAPSAAGILLVLACAYVTVGSTMGILAWFRGRQRR